MGARQVSSCWRSPSITATKGAELERMPSRQAPDRPRRAMRLTPRTRQSEAAISRMALMVPSFESLSTKTRLPIYPEQRFAQPGHNYPTLGLRSSVGIRMVSSTVPRPVQDLLVCLQAPQFRLVRGARWGSWTSTFILAAALARRRIASNRDDQDVEDPGTRHHARRCGVRRQHQ